MTELPYTFSWKQCEHIVRVLEGDWNMRDSWMKSIEIVRRILLDKRLDMLLSKFSRERNKLILNVLWATGTFNIVIQYSPDKHNEKYS